MGIMRGVSKKQNNLEVILMFESILVEDHGSTKEFGDLSVEIVGKEIYIGSNFKIKWKHVTSLQCYDNLEERAGESQLSSLRSSQEYRDEDYERAGFQLKAKTGNLKFGGEKERVFLVQYPIPPQGHRKVAETWERFSSLLKGAYEKEQKKRQRKVDREVAERKAEEEHRRDQQRKSSSRLRRNKTYSKRQELFMARNAANFARNAEVWSDEEDEVEQPIEDDNVAEVGRDDPVAETDDAANQNAVDDSEEEFLHGNDMDAEKVDIDDSPHIDQSNRSKKKRLRRKAPILEDSDDEDNGAFGTIDSDNSLPDTDAMTTTTKEFQRVVTPGMVGSIVVSGANKSLGLPDDEESASIIEMESTRTTKPINTFFKPRSKKTELPTEGATVDCLDVKVDEISDKKTVDGITVAENEQANSLNSFFTPRSKFSDKASQLTPMRTKTKASAPSTLLDNDGDSDGTATVVPEANATFGDPDDELPRSNTLMSPTFKAYSPKQSKMHSDLVRLSGSKVHDGSDIGRSIEEEDPIENPDSSQSQESPSFKRYRLSSSSRLTSSIKRRKLRLSKEPAKSALEALEFADARSLSPTSGVPRGDETGGIGSSSSDRSPLQPLRLGPQVEQAASEREWRRKWRGLRNDGNSCYVNSSLQQLFSAPQFMEALSRRHKSGKNDLTQRLVSLYQNLLGSDARTDAARKVGAASAKGVKIVIDRLTDRFHGCQQRDAHEFLGELIDQIHEEWSCTPKENENEEKENDGVFRGDQGGKCNAEPTDEFFRWNVQVCLECKNCGYSRSKEEMHRYLSIDIASEKDLDPEDPNFVKPAVDSCLANFFNPEDREINCEKCKVGKVATQTMKVLSLPKIILLHLKRFIVVEKPTGHKQSELVFQKNKAPVELSPTLSVAKLMGPKHLNPGKSDTIYNLKSIVHHIGSTANSGHYTTDASRMDPDTVNTEQWVSYDDGITEERSLSRVLGSVRSQRTAYMLMYSAQTN